ncbi:MAG: protein BatD, partial [Gluconacetobacter diazotrophicus]|nr:protein BatD [Gluconacetobacter diazotrophicus]
MYAAVALALAVFAAGIVLPPQLSAASSNTTVAASLSDSTVEAGGRVQFRITVTNGEADAAPRAPVVEGLSFSGPATSTFSQFSSIFGKGSESSTTTIYAFTVTANKPGRYTIPGQEVRVDGALLRSLPVALTVTGDGNAGGTAASGRARGPAFFDLILSKKSAYVGESVPVELRASYLVNLERDPDPNVILSGDGFSVQPFAAPKYARALPGQRYMVDSYKTAVAGLKIGTINVGPATIEPIVRLPLAPGRNAPGYLNPNDILTGDPFDAFSNLTVQQRIRLATSVASLEIKPLPEAGKPADFSGAIGQFKLEAEAMPAKAQTGDPVTIRLRLSGQGNFDRIAAPVPVEDRGLKVYPPSSKFAAGDDVGLNGVKTFEQVVIADGPRTTLPSYRFNYLDPATGRYVTVETPPLAVKIEGDRLATPTPAPTAAPAATPAATPTPPVPAATPEDIHYILAEPGPRRSLAAFRPLYRRPGFWAVQGALLAGALALAGTAGWRTRARDASNQRAARLARAPPRLRRCPAAVAGPHGELLGHRRGRDLQRRLR